MSRPIRVTMTVNGRRRHVTVPAMKRLRDVLREDLKLSGSKEGCGEGECGACSVLIDGKSVNSCLVPAAQASGARIVTIEGLARGRRLSALQRAFIELGGAQCGICTPGMLITATELLQRAKGRVPGDQEVREALAGNLCRCTGYQKIVDAVRAAARTRVSAKRAKARPRAAAARTRVSAKRSARPKTRRP
ncbi:MAG: (2Fe-2S)-binding protein [Candidatus Eisenbacteria bacterium]|nr:(2Fe-2S)-binding protein [Candidatus Eisenbacteria bacterium]